MSLWLYPHDDKGMQRINISDLPGTVYVGDPPW
jgi:hypothetical protein